LKKLEKEALSADRETVSRLLSSVDADDLVGQISLRSRLTEVDKKLSELESSYSTIGSVALMFAGNPVRGSKSIDADFASKMIGVYQDLVSMRIATEETGRLGSRGPVRFHTESALSITDVVRGSVGFVLEEACINHSLDDTAVKIAIDEVSKVIERTASESEADFEEAVETLDPRILSSLAEFFGTLDEGQATVRIVEDERDSSLDTRAIKRARDRVDKTTIEEKDDDSIIGTLHGIVTHAKRFELRLSDGRVIWGNVAAAVTPQYLALISDPTTSPVGKRWRVKMRIREVKERNKEPRLIYTLLGLLEEYAS
jgi:hypothetical protein